MSEPTGPPGTQATPQDESPEMREKAQEVAGQAQERAQEAAGQAQDMLREQVDQRSTQAGEKVSGTAQDLRSVGEELRNQGKETPAKLADQGAERIERLGSYLSESDADTLLSDIEDFGRRQPLVVLAGGLVVGMAAARFLKASSGSRYRSRFQAEGATREPRRQPPVAREIPAEPVGAPAAPPPQAPAGEPAMGR
ncbi:MAG TPA: hypothetical protein VFT10_08755 [Solirubrobacterales bacterium]|nr:hypothetical protein [Solirubrobacterales bacterium]